MDSEQPSAAGKDRIQVPLPQSVLLRDREWLSDLVTTALNGGVREVRLDLSATEHVDTAAAAAISQLASEARSRGAQLVLADVKGSARELVELLKLDHLLTVDEAHPGSEER